MKTKPNLMNTAGTPGRPIFRIWPGRVRSQRAVDSWKEFAVTDIPAVTAQDPKDMRSRERACSQAHANVLKAFLATDASHCIVIEDDVILCDRRWLSFTEFDYFLPFINHRIERASARCWILPGVMPQFGNQAAVVSRRFAEAMLPRLEAGVIADHANRQIAGMRVGCYASNGIIHDTAAASIISEDRRTSLCVRTPSSKVVRPGDGMPAKDAFCMLCDVWYAIADRVMRALAAGWRKPARDIVTGCNLQGTPVHIGRGTPSANS
jgi:hypothetical protein